MKGRSLDVAGCIILLGVALVLGTFRVSASGPLWPDAPRYANAGAMIHDWLRSGEWLHPFQFAKRNYCQYPAFNIPYHPPAYPGLLGLFFLVTGVSYLSARVFVALALGVSGCLFFAILRRMGVASGVALACALLLLTTPEVVRWSRSTMSEIPALMFVLAASYVFLAWLRTANPWHCGLAFGLVEVAFLSRLATAGVLPAWFLYAALSGQGRRLFSTHLGLAVLLYLGLNAGWLLFAVEFSKYETSWAVGPSLEQRLSWQNVCFYPAYLPAMVGWGALPVALVGGGYAFWLGRDCRAGLLWLSWLSSYYLFQLMLATWEQRYFLLALPAFPGLAACLFGQGIPGQWSRRLAPGLLGLVLVTNLLQVCQLPRGVVGYDAPAQRLALLEKPGNVLLACCEDQDLIFRYRACQPKVRRDLLRSDRTLAIRVYGFEGVLPTVHAQTAEDVVDVVRRGRIRYLVTCSPVDPQREDRTEEMIVSHNAALAQPQRFALIEKFPLLIQYKGPACLSEVYLWEFLGELPAGPSELPVLIPTAELEFQPDQ